MALADKLAAIDVSCLPDEPTRVAPRYSNPWWSSLVDDGTTVEEGKEIFLHDV
jgi:hypothetical protein